MAVVLPQLGINLWLVCSWIVTGLAVYALFGPLHTRERQVRHTANHWPLHKHDMTPQVCTGGTRVCLQLCSLYMRLCGACVGTDIHGEATHIQTQTHTHTHRV